MVIFDKLGKTTRAACFGLFLAMTVSSPALAMDVVRVSLLPYLTFAPLFIAEDEGYFKAENINIDFQKIKTSDAIALLAQGELDVQAGFVSTGFFNAIGRGANLKIVADKGYADADSCGADAVMVPAASYQEISSAPTLLRSRPISISAASVEEFLIERMFESIGLDYRENQNLRLRGPSELDALRKGQVSLVLTGEPWVSRIRDAGAGEIFKPVREIYPDFQFAILSFGPTLLQGNRDLGKRFMRAYLRGVRQYNEGATDRNVDIITNHMKLDEDTLNRICWPQFRNDGQINTTSVKDFHDWAVRHELVRTALQLDDYWDAGFLTQP